MPLENVDLAAVAARTDGYTGADLKALCQQAALAAMVRTDARAVTVGGADFEAAIAAVKPGQTAEYKSGEYL
jgi:transitional endoplasmic reticulum ATPase